MANPNTGFHYFYTAKGSKHDSSMVKALHATRVSDQHSFEKAIQLSDANSVWLSGSVDALAHFITHSRYTHAPASVGRRPKLLSFERINDPLSTLIGILFSSVVEAQGKAFLPTDQLIEVLSSENRTDLAIGAEIDPKLGILILWRGNLTPLVVPLSTFKESGTGVKPDFGDVEVIDFGQTVRLGKYEAAVDVILYEIDPDYRRRQRSRMLAEDKSFGASLRRLRLQKGLTQADFDGLTQREIGRIERGEVRRPRQSTVARLAKALQVAPEEIGTF
jgi:hypothetical protein